MATINIESLGSEIARMMDEYAADVTMDLKSDAKAVAKEAVKELKQKSPEGAGSRKGHYKDGWGITVQEETGNSIGITIHNKKKPGLTHLLENGHAKRGGGRVAAIPHIELVEKKLIHEYEKRLEERLSR